MISERARRVYLMILTILSALAFLWGLACGFLQQLGVIE